MRVEKKITNKGDNTTETTQYFYHGKKLMRQVKGNHVLHFYYDAEGRPAMVMHNGVMYTYAHSLQGDIAAIVDNAGNKMTKTAINKAMIHAMKMTAKTSAITLGSSTVVSMW